MSNRLVSVVIPAFNRAAVIGRALESVAAQTYRDFEIIVVDDGSTDETAQVARDSGITGLRVVTHPQNRGAGVARNTGIAAAAGHLIAFLDSDDIWHPDKLARQVAALDRAPLNIKACASGYQLHKGDRKLTVCPVLQPGTFRNEILFGCNISPGTTLVVDRGIFDTIGMFDEKLRRLEDWEWLLRFAEHHDLLILPEPLATIYLEPSVARSVRDGEYPYFHAVQHIAAKHLPRFRTAGGMSLRKFRSTLFVEIAGEMYRKRHVMQAVGYVLRSFLIYPFRNVAFYRSIWRSVRTLARS